MNITANICATLLLFPERAAQRSFHNEETLETDFGKNWRDILVHRLRLHHPEFNLEELNDYISAVFIESSDSYLGLWKTLKSQLDLTPYWANNELYLATNDLVHCHRLLGFMPNLPFIAMLAQLDELTPMLTKKEPPLLGPVLRLTKKRHKNHRLFSKQGYFVDTHLHLGGCSTAEYCWHHLLRYIGGNQRNARQIIRTYVPSAANQTLYHAFGLPSLEDCITLVAEAIDWTWEKFGNNLTLFQRNYAIIGAPTELNHSKIMQDELAFYMELAAHVMEGNAEATKQFDKLFAGRAIIHQAITHHDFGGEGLKSMIAFMGRAKKVKEDSLAALNTKKTFKLSTLACDDAFKEWDRLLFLASWRGLKALEVRLSAHDDDAHKLWDDMRLIQKLWRASWVMLDYRHQGNTIFTTDARLLRDGLKEHNPKQKIPQLRLSVFLRKDMNFMQEGREPLKNIDACYHSIYKQTAQMRAFDHIVAERSKKEKIDRDSLSVHRYDLAGLERYVPSWPYHFALRLLVCDPEAIQTFKKLKRFIDPEICRHWLDLFEDNKHLRPSWMPVPRLCVHAGEEYHSPLDGLVQIDRLRANGLFQSNGFIGHGLLLGVNLHKWFQNHKAEILIPRGLWFDSLLWIASRSKYSQRVCDETKNQIYEQLEYILCDLQPEMPQDLPEIRRDLPEIRRDLLNLPFYQLAKVFRYLDLPPLSISLDVLQEWALLPNFTAIRESRLGDFSGLVSTHSEAKVLYLAQAMIKDEDVCRQRGEKILVRFTQSLQDITKELQEELINHILERGIPLEFSPTSNQRVYRSLPIVKLPTMRLWKKIHDDPERSQALKITINTDDPGTFNTRIENEAALFFDAVETIATKEQRDAECKKTQTAEEAVQKAVQIAEDMLDIT